MAHDNENTPTLEEEIALGIQLRELEKQVKKKISIENLNYFSNPKKEQLKQKEKECGDYWDWVGIIIQLDAEMSRTELHDSDKATGEDNNWQQRTQEHFINKLKLVRNSTRRYNEGDE